MVTVAEFIANFLCKNGITDIFMISGGGAIHLDNAVAKCGIREVCIKNEATGPMMAKAYAQVTSNFGVVYVTTGPGGANAVTGVAECFVDSSPVLVISGQAPLAQTTHRANIKGLRSFGVQELNIIDIVKPITKYATMLTDPSNILYELQKAIAVMKDGRPGPVWLDIPLDIQSAEIDPSKLVGYGDLSTEPRQSWDVINRNINELIGALHNSKRPLIVIGQGARGADKELKEVAEILDAPIIPSRMGLDILPLSYKHNMGIGGIKGQPYNKQVMKEADLVLSIGTSLSVAFAGFNLSFFDNHTRTHNVWMVDIEKAEMLKFDSVFQPIFIQIDAKLFLELLRNSLLNNQVKSKTEWLKRCLELKIEQGIQPPKKNPIDIYYLTKMIDEVSTENDIFVDDAGSIYYVAGQTLTFSKGQKEITSGAFASMGNALPLAIGAAIANRDMRILAMTGDGSIETNIQELKTLSYYGLNVKLFILNNGGYISMRDHGRHAVGEQGGSMLTLDKVAEAYNLPYTRIDDYRQLSHLNEILATSGPHFIEVMCDDKQKLVLPS